MLEGLDDIDWASLEDAYGAASELPDMIRRLASSDDAEQRDALYDVKASIVVQGIRFPATPKALPFLIELAGRPDISKDAVVDLLVLIRHCVAGSFNIGDGPCSGSGPIWGTATQPMIDDAEFMQILQECEAAAEPAVSMCLRRIAEGYTTQTMEALFLIAALHPYAERYEIVPRLQKLHAHEQPIAVRSMVAFALTHVLPVGQEATLVDVALHDVDDLVRVIATMGCVRRGCATPEMTHAMLRWLEDDRLTAKYAELPCHVEDLAGDLTRFLGSLDRAVLAPALPTLVEKLSLADNIGVCTILPGALAAVFGREMAPSDATTLTADQRRVLETLLPTTAAPAARDVSGSRTARG
jgi:hypothetical protein